MDDRAYSDRVDAGRRMAAVLAKQVRVDDPLVLALPRGGVPIGAEIARALDAELDVLVALKLPHPAQPDLAIGAVAGGGVHVLLPQHSATLEPATLQAIITRAEHEVERRTVAYRSARGRVDLRDRHVILVDDGLATGATMLAAIRAVRAAGARHVIVAVPVGDPGVCARLGREADRVLCPVQPTSVDAVNTWYEQFPRLTDQDVLAALDAVRQERLVGGPRRLDAS